MMDTQQTLSLDTKFEIEHIFSRGRQDKEKLLSNNKSLELLGNKALLEKSINIRAADYKFEDKKKYYRGYINSRNREIDGTKISELTAMADNFSDFTEKDILVRNSNIKKGFLDYLSNNNLIR